MKFPNGTKVDIFYVIVLIPLECCSCRCTLSLYNAFMWTVSVKAAQSELNESELHTNEDRHVTFLNLYIDDQIPAFVQFALKHGARYSEITMRWHVMHRQRRA